MHCDVYTTYKPIERHISASMVRFIHSNDWQLGMAPYFLDADAQARFAKSRFDAIRRIGQLAESKNASFVVVAGDVFESNQLDPRTVARALEAMRSVPVPIYLLPGNHDPLDPVSVYHSKAFGDGKPDKVIVLSSTTPLEVAEGCEIVGVPWSSKRPLVDLVQAACKDLGEKSGVVRIVVAHGVVDVNSPDKANPALIGLEHAESFLRENRVHYIALGDHHSVLNVGDSGRIRYAGTPEPTDFGEQKPGYVLLVDVDESRCEVEEIPIAEWRFVAKHFDFSGDEDLVLLESFLDENPKKEETVLRLSFKGTVSLESRVRLDEILDRYRNLYATIQVREGGDELVTLPSDTDLERLNLTGWARVTLDNLRTMVSPPQVDQTAQNALTLMYRLARGGKE
jgi:DNA repair exonuclease SbcCD nuclease subunit